MATLTPTDPNDLTKADASPTKAFFVDIITKDILLDEAIQDLVDNCIDGAKRLRPGGDPDFTGLWVNLNVSKDGFEISDNCGGIPLEIARKYAFKFGRAKGFAPTTRSVGQFGVGMKRALFKMGDHFSIQTTEPEYSYSITVDVEKWANDDVHWDFDIADLIGGPFGHDKLGTHITARPLETGVAETLGQSIFQTKLRNDLRIVHQDPMRRGLTITMNGKAIIPTVWQLKESAGVGPAVITFSDDLGGTAPLQTRLYAGVGESNRASAGWFVFCNGRCILEADQTGVTGWNEVSDEGVGLPKYHGQFARFRGYAFLDSDDASILPWNTTKTSLDLESDAYRRLKGRLIDATRPVIDFLNQLDAEKDLEPNDKVLTSVVADAPSISLERLTQRTVFRYTPPPKRGPALTRITFQKPQAEASQLKTLLGAKSASDTGAKAFEYALSNLSEDD